MGIPVIGCRCVVCASTSPNNKRMRPSALITLDNKRILIDAGPDFRSQALHYKINHLDGVIFTHGHHDHTAGIDDLRAFYIWNRKPMPCLVSNETAQELMTRFSYIFAENAHKHKLVSRIDLQLLEKERGEVNFLGFKFSYFSFEQGGMQVNGFRFGNLAFISDIKIFPETIFEDLEGVEKLVISALRFETSELHFSIPEAIQFSKRIGAKETWLTHISHEVDHEKVSQDLPSNVHLAYDGLSIDFSM